jgi:hypothetical protein
MKIQTPQITRVRPRGRRVVEGVAAVDDLEAADKLFGKKKVLLYPVGVYIGG